MASTPPNDRDAKGRFRKGHPGNRNATGRPPRAVEHDYLSATIGAVSVSEWVAVVVKALDQAKDGDAKARDWLSRVLIGAEPIAAQQLMKELEAELERAKHV